MTVMDDMPNCPECDMPINNLGECVECDYELPRKDFRRHEESPAAIHDSEYEHTSIVESEVTVTEFSELLSYSSRESWAYVMVRASYPTGSYEMQVPMLPTGGALDGKNLERIVRLESYHSNHPWFAAIYTDSMSPDMRMMFDITDDEAEVKTYNGDDDFRGEVTEVLWRRDDPRATDPINDIALHDTDTSHD